MAMKFHSRFVAVMAIAALILGPYVLGAQARGASPQDSSDNTIVTDIEAKLFTDPVLKTLNVHVASQGGVVTLSGTVNTNIEKADIERIASQEPGVKQVVDNLTVKGQPSGSAPAASSGATRPPAKVSVTVPAGTPVVVQMIDAVDSAANKPGDKFDATVYSPIDVGNYVAIPEYSEARVQLVDVASAGHIKGRSEVALELVSLTVNGTKYEVESNYYEQEGKSRGKQTAKRVAGGGVLGGILGGVLGRGKGAAIGAALGAATAAGVQEATKGQQVKVESEAVLNFVLKAPVTITSVAAGIAPAPGSSPVPQAPSASGLTGMWLDYIPTFQKPIKVTIQLTGKRLVGTVVTGNSWIPAGKMLFYGNSNSNSFDAQEICAGPNYSNPRWAAVKFKVIDNNHLQEDWTYNGGFFCNGNPALWERTQ